jgi:tRNA1(Val) A37 N6-methylase TrmN6
VTAAAATSADVTEDAFLGGRLTIQQPKSGYRAGLDAVLLAASLRAGPGDRVLDAGAGVGVVGLAAAHRIAGIEVVLVEQDHGLADLARSNVARNGLEARVRVVVADVAQPLSAHPELLAEAGRFDHALANPPYHVEGRGTASHNPVKAAAHAMPDGTLERWVRFMAAMVKPGGTATLIHRADALHDLLTALDGRFGAVAIAPIHGHEGKPASRVLLRATRGSRAPLQLRPGIVLHQEHGYRPEIESVLRGGAALNCFEDA